MAPSLDTLINKFFNKGGKMICKNCASPVAIGAQTCAKCGAGQEVSQPQIQNTAKTEAGKVAAITCLVLFAIGVVGYIILVNSINGFFRSI